MLWAFNQIKSFWHVQRGLIFLRYQKKNVPDIPPQVVHSPSNRQMVSLLSCTSSMCFKMCPYHLLQAVVLFPPCHVNRNKSFNGWMNHSSHTEWNFFQDGTYWIKNIFMLVSVVKLDTCDRPAVSPCLTKLLPKPARSGKRLSVRLFALYLMSKCRPVLLKLPRLQHPPLQGCRSFLS